MSGAWLRIHNIITSGLIAALFLFLTPQANAQTCSVPGTDGLVAHWKLDEASGNAIDSSGSFDASATGSLLYSQTGIVGTAINFDGSGNYFETSSAVIDPASTDFTVAAWLNSSDVSASGGTAIGQLDGTGTGRTWIETQDGNLETYIGNGVKVSTYVPSNDTWFHAVLVHDNAGNTLDWYIDGVFENQHTGVNAEASNGNLRIGSNKLGVDFEGLIDDVRIYDRALSADEIAALYAQRSNDTPAAGTIAFNERYAQMMYCDGTNWKMMGLGSYNPNAVEFDGTNDYLTRGGTLTGIADSKLWTVSAWFRRNALSTAVDQGILDTTAPDQTIEFEGTGGTDGLLVIDADGGAVVDVDVGIINDTNWHHLLYSFDMANAATRKIYIDDVDVTGSATFVAYVDSVIDFDGSAEYSIGASTGGGGGFDGDIADFWYDAGTFLDLSVEANRRKFISANGMPKYLGADGSLPTGSPPDIFLSGDTENWHTNRGTGGGFTENGALTTAVTQPADGVDITVPMGWTSLLSNELAYVVAAFESSGCKPTITNVSYDSMSAAGSSFTLSSYAVPALTDGMLIVVIGAEDDNGAGDAVPVSVTFNGANNLTEAVTETQANDDKTASIFYLGNPPQVTGDIVVTVTGTVEAIQVGAYVADCLKNQAPLATASNASPTWQDSKLTAEIVGEHPSGTLLVDSFEHGNSAANGATPYYDEQTALFARNSKNATSSHFASFRYFSECSAPEGESGTIIYSSSFNVMQYCNGREWVAMGPLGVSQNNISGLIGHWKLDESSGGVATDETGNHDGTLTGAQQWLPDGGVIDGALQVGGPNLDRINVASLDDANFPDNGTFLIWVNTDDYTVQDGIFSDYRGVKNQLYIRAYTAASGIQVTFQRYDGSSTAVWSTIQPLPASEWSHIAVSWDTDNDIGTLYINGERRIAEAISDSAWVPNEQEMNFGQFPGYMDDVRLYNRVLTEAEVQQVYLETYPAFSDGPCTNPNGEEGVMLYSADHSTLQYCNGERWIGIGK